MLFAVFVFPGSNCYHDVYHVAKHVLGCAARYVWHKDRDLRGADVVVLPGGFSYGDYLRTGAIARFSPIMEEIRKFAQRGGHVIGICPKDWWCRPARRRRGPRRCRPSLPGCDGSTGASCRARDPAPGPARASNR